jgi:hypothetical protein
MDTERVNPNPPQRQLELLPEQTLGVPTPWALVVIPLSVAPEILSESQIWVQSQIFDL